jgi:diketogulonate reductase-like aldo/keto reductase
MEAICREGRCKALGVCNFNAAALSDLLPHVSIRPVVNQVERHPFLPQMDLLDFCGSQSIHVQAHTPLGQGTDELLANDVVMAVARESSQSAANVVLQWNLQQGVSVVPKCQSQSHMKELSQFKPLSAEQMERLDGLGCGKRFVAPHFMFGRASYCWGP